MEKKNLIMETIGQKDLQEPGDFRLDGCIINNIDFIALEVRQSVIIENCIIRTFKYIPVGCTEE